MSGFERDLGLFVIANREDKNIEANSKKIRAYQDLIVDNHHKTKEMKDYAMEVLKYRRELDIAGEIGKWEPPRFPVNGHDLKLAGCPPGKYMSIVLQNLKNVWKQSEFKLSRDELLEKLPHVIENLDYSAIPSKSKKKRKNSR